MNSRQLAAVIAAALVVAVGSLSAGTDPRVPGEKIDSGLGELPHYLEWADAKGRNPLRLQHAAKAGKPATVAGEKLDSGLGELPHYSKWADATGRDPMGVRGVQTARVER